MVRYEKHFIKLPGFSEKSEHFRSVPKNVVYLSNNYLCVFLVKTYFCTYKNVPYVLMLLVAT